MRDFGDMGHGEVLFLPRPGRQPEPDMARRNAVLVGGDARRKEERRGVEGAQRPDPAGADLVMRVAGSDEAQRMSDLWKEPTLYSRSRRGPVDAPSCRRGG